MTIRAPIVILTQSLAMFHQLKVICLGTWMDTFRHVKIVSRGRVGWNCMLRNRRQFVERHRSEMAEELERLSRWLDWPTIASPPFESDTNTDTMENINTL